MGRATRLLLLASVCAAAFAIHDAAPPAARAQATHRTFPLRFHLVEDPSRHWEAALRWIQGQVAEANALFAGADVQFVAIDIYAEPASGPAWVFEAEPSGQSSASLGSALALRSATPEATVGLDVFVVPRIQDATACAVGVALAPDSSSGSRGLIALTPANGPTLAHQLGHFFQLEDSGDLGNLMFAAGTRRPVGPLTLNDAQLQTIGRQADVFLREGTVRVFADVPRPRGPSVRDGL